MNDNKLQQYLPFTVLKLIYIKREVKNFFLVATVLTVYGIETKKDNIYANIELSLQQYLPFTVLKPSLLPLMLSAVTSVATVLTVYGIETA